VDKAKIHIQEMCTFRGSKNGLMNVLTTLQIAVSYSWSNCSRALGSSLFKSERERKNVLIMIVQWDAWNIGAIQSPFLR
jgi:hypothetical protein